ncbi:FAD-dependent monooxygenase [Spirillospora sp. CA-142024]|uniref:FAD-dependent monooxygenase n=1 Tax=Spirillospora sp. CA-142024 TaxID=3240036 RepID=UPI003D9311B6
MTRIMIVGGGIAGNAAALALDRAGFEVAVHEAHPDGAADIGAFLTLASNGMAALAQVGAADAVAASGFPITRLRLTDATGAELASRPLRGHDAPLTRYRCLRRATLCRVLQSEVRRRGIPLHHGRRLDSVDEDAGGVTARFDDGRTERADLLVGADGLGSTVRPVINPDGARPRHVGQRVFYGYSTRAAPPSAPERIDMIRGTTTAFGYLVSPAGETYWFARVPGPELTPGEIAGGGPRWRDALLPQLRGDATPAAGIVAATGDRLMVTDAHDLPDVPRWHTDRIVIIGDAAHTASPATGQGASMALEDAVVLAKAVRDTTGLHQALTRYESLRRPRTQANIAASARMSGADVPAHLSGHPAPPTDDEMLGQLDWSTPLPPAS